MSLTRKMGSQKAALVVGILIFIVGIPTSLGQGIWSHIRPIRGLDIFRFLRFHCFKRIITTRRNAYCYLQRMVLGYRKMREEGNLGAKSIKLGGFFDILIKIISPICIFIIFLNSIGILKV